MSVNLQSWTAAHAADMLTEPTVADHKYSRGVLGVRTGSARYPGAAVLTVEAAWRTGLGLVQFASPLNDEPARFGLPSPAAAVLAQRPETVFTAGDAAGDAPSPSRCNAWLIGSGTDPSLLSDAERHALHALMRGQTPVVVDAGALELVPSAAAQAGLAPLILTPHRGEFTKLWSAAGLSDNVAHDANDAAQLANHLGVTVLLKGSVTIAAAPGQPALTVGPATPWLATAGTGDVLAGLLGALVATHADQVSNDASLLAQLGATAALVHDIAAQLASRAVGSSTARPIVASDVAQALPAAVSLVREGRATAHR
jgi:hydroxyethylthiazole kinase-like uncharacterized protein yjeF